MERLDVRPKEAVYVGDSVTDAEAARHAGIAFVAFLLGTTPREAFDACKAFAVIDRLADLCEVVARTDGPFQ